MSKAVFLIPLIMLTMAGYITITQAQPVLPRITELTGNSATDPADDEDSRPETGSLSSTPAPASPPPAVPEYQISAAGSAAASNTAECSVTVNGKEYKSEPRQVGDKYICDTGVEEQTDSGDLSVSSRSRAESSGGADASATSTSNIQIDF